MNDRLTKLGWSQAYLAKKLAVSETTVTRWSRRGAPGSVLGYLDAMVRMREIGEALVVETEQPKSAPRGRHSRRERSGVWERSATDHAPQAVDRSEYMSKLDGWGRG